MNPMILTVPAAPEWTLVMRMAASGVCALFSVPVDVMEDLSTAIEESCDLLLHQDYTAETLTMTCEGLEGSLRVTVSSQERTRCPDPEKADPDIALLIIQTLVRDVRLDRDEAGVHTVCMTLPAGV